MLSFFSFRGFLIRLKNLRETVVSLTANFELSESITDIAKDSEYFTGALKRTLLRTLKKKEKKKENGKRKENSFFF